MKKIIIFLLCLSLLIISMDSIMVKANSNYSAYTYDEWNESAESPASYNAEFSRLGTELLVGAFKEPQDIFADNNGKLYIADTGNNRIVILDEELNLIEVIDHVYEDFGEVPLTDPQGIHVTDDGIIYISQTSLARVIAVKGNQIVKKIEKPVHSLISEDFNFQPTRIAVDKYGRLYVLSKGCYSGLLRFSPKGEFIEFYGANKVEVTAEVVFQYMWKNLLSDEQRGAMTSILPIEYSSVTSHSDGFIYTTTVGMETFFNQVKRLNPLGENTYFRRGNRYINFGDYEVQSVKGVMVKPSFIDLCVDEDGFVFGLDMTNSRVFLRDQEGNLLGVFGGYGKQLGTFETAIAITVHKENIYVLDSLKGNVTLFVPTEYGSLIREATKYYNEGDYEASAALWKEAGIRNGNNIAAYIGQGKAEMQKYNYKEAMEQLKSGGERFTYSRAFSKYRLELIREYAPYAIVLLILLIFLLSIVHKILKKFKFKGIQKKPDILLKQRKNAPNPFYTIFHPFDASYDIRFKEKGNLIVAAAILIVWFFASIIERQNTGYVFNNNKISELNVFLQLAKVMIPFFMWICGNLIVSILMNGTGRSKDIFIYSAYSAVPHIMGMLVCIMLSNVLSRNEPFGQYIAVFGTAWSLIMLFIGMMVIHEYKFKENIASCLFSVGVMGILLFLSMLVGNLYTEFSGFIKSVVQEILFRI